VSKPELLDALRRRAAPWLTAELVPIVEHSVDAHPELFQMLGADPAGAELQPRKEIDALVAVTVVALRHVGKEYLVGRYE
jgi:hypothetical protein